MAHFVTFFASSDVAATHREFAAALREVRAYNSWARSHGQPQRLELEARLNRAYAVFSRDVDRAAHVGARAAEQGMKDILKRTQLRPDTDRKPHLRDLLTARPVTPPGLHGIATGAVGVADVEKLDRAVDPDFAHDGTYWRAQNYGTTKHVGRFIFGYFHGGGSVSKPLASMAGGGSPQHDPMFSPTSQISGPRGGIGGPGEIHVPLKPRRFVEGGARIGERAWLDAMAAAQADALLSVRRALGIGGGRGTGRAAPRPSRRRRI